jgi:hypothetical protein
MLGPEPGTRSGPVWPTVWSGCPARWGLSPEEKVSGAGRGDRQDRWPCGPASRDEGERAAVGSGGQTPPGPRTSVRSEPGCGQLCARAAVGGAGRGRRAPGAGDPGAMAGIILALWASLVSAELAKMPGKGWAGGPGPGPRAGRPPTRVAAHSWEPELLLLLQGQTRDPVSAHRVPRQRASLHLPRGGPLRQ